MEVLYVVAGLDWVESLILFYVYMIAANSLSRAHARHTVEPPEWIQDVLVMSRNITGKFSICGVIWGTVTYVSWILFLIGRLLVGHLYSIEAYAAVTKSIIYGEFILILCPLILYSVYCWRKFELEHPIE